MSAFQLVLSLLLHQKLKHSLALLSIAAAAMFMFLELCFFIGVNQSQAQLAHSLNADLVLSHREKTHLKVGSEFHRLLLNVCRSLPEVEAISACYTEAQYWIDPTTGRRSRVLSVGVDLEQIMLDLPELVELKEKLRKPMTLLIGKNSRPELGALLPGKSVLLNHQKVDIVGLTSLASNFSYEGYCVMSHETFFRLAGDPLQKNIQIDLGLIRLANKADLASSRLKLQNLLGEDVLLLTPTELQQREYRMVILHSPAGPVFGIGLIVSYLMGLLICRQVLFNELHDQNRQLALLSALGYSKNYLLKIMWFFMLFSCHAGFLIALVTIGLLLDDLSKRSNLPLNLDLTRVFLVYLGVISMGVLSVLTMSRYRSKIDPAELCA